jgi:hypothetical protein
MRATLISDKFAFEHPIVMNAFTMVLRSPVSRTAYYWYTPYIP